MQTCDNTTAATIVPLAYRSITQEFSVHLLLTYCRAIASVTVPTVATELQYPEQTKTDPTRGLGAFDTL